MKILEEKNTQLGRRPAVLSQGGDSEAAAGNGALLTESREGSSSQGEGAKYATAAILLLVAYAAIRNTLHAEQKPFWYDELCTWIVTHEPGISGIWNALIRGADSAPPGFYLIEKLFAKLIHNEEIAFRMPSILGFSSLIWFLFVWLKTRYGPGIALVGAQVPFITALYATYAAEARPYALPCAFLAAALVCYQRAPGLRWMILLGLSLALAESQHYYSLFAFTPFLAAETLYLWKQKAIRWRVWVALGFGAVPLAASWPLLQSLKSIYGQSFWAEPSLLLTWATYGWLIGIPLKAHAGFSWNVMVNLLVASGTIALAMLLLFRSLRSKMGVRHHFTDGPLIASFLLLPLVFYLGTKLSHGGLTARYMLPTVVGLAMATGYLLSRLRRRMVLFAGLALFACFAVQEAAFWIAYYGSYQLGFARPQSSEHLIASVDHANLRVVVTDPHHFLELAHYAGPNLRSRLSSAVDPAAARRYTGADSTERELLVFRELTPFPIFEYSAFRAAHPTFLLYSNPTADDGSDWWLSRIALDGHSLKRLAKDRQGSVYLVESNHR